ncbi:MAG: hypothetical protein J07HQX50_00870 [Haloquadratum sp. J07HQX50]|nr:MAG: hypothetical protein J07HQX50_00870 [Haloquadratum sp. J07HQX50]
MIVHSLSVSLAAAAVINNLIDIPLARVRVKTLKWLVPGFLTPSTSALATVLCSLHTSNSLRGGNYHWCDRTPNTILVYSVPISTPRRYLRLLFRRAKVPRSGRTCTHARMDRRGHSNFFATLVPPDTIQDKRPDTLSNVSLHDCFETFRIASSSQSVSDQNRRHRRIKNCCT